MSEDGESDIDPDVCEAAGLAHDLGHAPFGHIGEETLDQVLRSFDRDRGGYEGNPQSFRIATRLGTSDSDPGKVDGDLGFNLTRRTLNAIFKYPWIEGEGPNPQKIPAKCGAYKCDIEAFDWVRSHSKSTARTIEAEIMDWADDITFAVHDLMDFYQAGKIPLDAINSSAGGSKELNAFIDSTFARNKQLDAERNRYETALKRILEYISFEQRFEGTRAQRETIWKNSTLLITRFLTQMELHTSAGAKRLVIAQEGKDEVKMLKEFTWHYVILHHDLAMQQHGQKHMLKTVLEELLERSREQDKWSVFPPLTRHRLSAADEKSESIGRVVVDHVASMSDLEVSTTYRHMRGRK